MRARDTPTADEYAGRALAFAAELGGRVDRLVIHAMPATMR